MEVRTMKNFKDFLKRIYLFPVNMLLGVTTTAVVGTAAVPYRSMGKSFITPPATVTVPLTAVTNDVVQCVPYLKGWLIEGIIVKMLTRGTATTITGQFGITGGTTNGFAASADLTAAGPFLSPLAGTYPAAGGFLAAADGTVDLLLSTITLMTVAPIISVQLIVNDTN